MAYRTVFLARLIGLYCLIAGATMAVHRDAVIGIVTALLHDGPVLYLSGVILLAAGLAMVLVHNLWSGGAPPIVVTLISWATLVKGIFFLLASPAQIADFYLVHLHYTECFYVIVAFTLVLGAYLTAAGFRAAKV